MTGTTTYGSVGSYKLSYRDYKLCLKKLLLNKQHFATAYLSCNFMKAEPLILLLLIMIIMSIYAPKWIKWNWKTLANELMQQCFTFRLRHMLTNKNQMC